MTVRVCERFSPAGSVAVRITSKVLLLPESVRAGLAAMHTRPIVVVHDGEGSRVPWETLRAGDVHPALEGGLTRRYASDTLTVARWNEHRTPGAGTRHVGAIEVEVARESGHEVGHRGRHGHKCRSARGLASSDVEARSVPAGGGLAEAYSCCNIESR
jgi:hypothetical protein